MDEISTVRRPSDNAPDERESWRETFEDVRKRCASTPKVGLMKLKLVRGEFRYAVAFRESSDLWLTLWVRRSPKGEFFIMIPRGDKDRDVHTSYHLDGTLHHKSHGRKVLPAQKRQPLTADFRGTESLGIFAGHVMRLVGDRMLSGCAVKLSFSADAVHPVPLMTRLQNGTTSTKLLEQGDI